VIYGTLARHGDIATPVEKRAFAVTVVLGDVDELGEKDDVVDSPVWADHACTHRSQRSDLVMSFSDQHAPPHFVTLVSWQLALRSAPFLPAPGSSYGIPGHRSGPTAAIAFSVSMSIL